MKTTDVVLSVLLLLCPSLPLSASEGYSPDILAKLVATPPQWLKLGAAVRLEPAGTYDVERIQLRPITGNVTYTRTKVTLPSHGVTITPENPVSWFRGCSLSPDGRKLVVNSGSVTSFYQINQDGSYQKIDVRVPAMTYGSWPRGFIQDWSWAADDMLVGHGEVADETGKVIRNAVYFFDITRQELRRVDDSSYPEASGAKVVQVGTDLEHLLLEVNGQLMLVKAVLRPR